jgi:hypothetical protein
LITLINTTIVILAIAGAISLGTWLTLLVQYLINRNKTVPRSAAEIELDFSDDARNRSIREKREAEQAVKDLRAQLDTLNNQIVTRLLNK